ncbi:hypothetical protein CSAL01_08277 [Colletotrichum salicis]|uniref:Uncharacterized protein n=1 Tax=Colletotrichum salicis TaxID=1209931 RepID=A0A135V6S9_9PEZI|nr:hypothetical protein CSAL01_08277 [Colletotrichum salicis]
MLTPTGTPTLICLAPEVFNIGYLSSLTSRSRLLPALSSVFQDLDNIESRRLRDHVSAPESIPLYNLHELAHNGAVDGYRHRIWRLMRGQIPPFEEAKFAQQQPRELATHPDETSRDPSFDFMTYHGARSEDEASLRDELDLATNDELQANQHRNILETLSDIDIEFGQNKDPSWTVDENSFLSSSPLTMKFLADRSELEDEQEDCDDEGCYPEDISNYDVNLEASGALCSPLPLSCFGGPSDPNNEADPEAHRQGWAFDLADTSLPPLHSTRELVRDTPGSYSDWSNSGLNMEDENDFAAGYDADGPQRLRSTSLVSYSDWRSDEDKGPLSELSFQTTSNDRQPDGDEIYGGSEFGGWETTPQDYMWPREVFPGSEIDLDEDDQIE